MGVPGSASVKKHHLDSETELVFLRKVTKLVWVKRVSVEGNKAQWQACGLRVRQDASSPEL